MTVDALVINIGSNGFLACVLSATLPIVLGYGYGHLIGEGRARTQKNASAHDDTSSVAKAQLVLDGELEKLESLQEELKERESLISKSEKELAERQNVLDELEKMLRDRATVLEDQESLLLERERKLVADQTVIERKESYEEEQPADSKAGSEIDQKPTSQETEKEKRVRWIKKELQDVIKQTEETELEEDFEPEAIEALEKAAAIVCYRKKYYDVMKDELIYFSSVNNTIVSYDLMEEAEKYYFDEEDEFPLEYCAALRSTATSNMYEDDDDVDEGYMAKLSLDVEI